MSKIISLPSSLNPNEVQIVMLNGSKVSAQYKVYYEAAYQHWHQIWETHFKERDGISRLFSDNFTRQDEISCLFWKSNCLSVVTTRAVDFNRSSFRRDSYFEVWDEEALNQLTKLGNNIAICSQFSVVPGCPSFENGVRVRDVMVHLVISHLRRCGFDSITGTARKDKGMQKSFSLGGAELIKADLPMHGGLVDLMGFYKTGKCGFDQSVEDISHFIWMNRVGDGEFNETQKNILKVA